MDFGAFASERIGEPATRAQVTNGQVNEDWPAELNKLVWKGGHDLVLSVGQARFAEHGIGPTAVTGARVAAHNMQHAAYSVQHATYNSVTNVRRATYNSPAIAKNVKNT